MELYNATGKTKTEEIRNAKPIFALLIQTDCPFDEISTETITVFVERANGSNTEIANQVLLKDFIMLSTYGQSAVYSGNGYKTNALCELTAGGAVALAENEAVKFKLDNLKSAKTYVVNGLEEFASTDVLSKFDRKVALSEETQRDFETSKYNSVAITNYSALEELQLTFDNGQVCKYKKAEVIALSVDADPVQRLFNSATADGLAQSVDVLLNDKLVLPLVGVQKLQVIKAIGNSVNLTFKANQYN